MSAAEGLPPEALEDNSDDSMNDLLGMMLFRGAIGADIFFGEGELLGAMADTAGVLADGASGVLK